MSRAKSPTGSGHLGNHRSAVCRARIKATKSRDLHILGHLPLCQEHRIQDSTKQTNQSLTLTATLTLTRIPIPILVCSRHKKSSGSEESTPKSPGGSLELRQTYFEHHLHHHQPHDTGRGGLVCRDRFVCQEHVMFFNCCCVSVPRREATKRLMLKDLHPAGVAKWKSGVGVLYVA